MAASEPTDDDISQVIEFVACDGETARRYLKVKNNDVNAAAMAILDGEDISQAESGMGWSEDDFNADRDGNVPFDPSQAGNNHDEAQYQTDIQALTSSLHKAFNDSSNLHPLGAPTRGSTPVPPFRQPATLDEEDAEMQQAIANSQHDATFGQQETGVVRSSVKPSLSTFGPATRDNYDATKWALTLPGQEIMPDPEPLDRAYKHGEPRFLKPLVSQSYLPNLLTILHSIPLARSALLLPEYTRPSYGQDSDWWKGHSIRLPRIVSTVDLSAAEPATSQSDEMIAEMQRLMALLDASLRAYGSVDALLRLDAVNNVTSELPTETHMEKVLHAWESSVKASAPDQSTRAEIFRSVMGTNDPDGIATPYMRAVPLPCDADNEDGSVTLVEALNTLLWDTDEPEGYDNYIEQPAEVLTMHISRKGQEKTGLIIPPSFYIDQYLKEHIDATKSLRKSISDAKHRLSKLQAVQEKLQTMKRPGGSQVNADLVLNHVVAHFSGENQRALLEERIQSGAGADLNLPSPSLEHQDLATRLGRVHADIKAKIDEVKTEAEKSSRLLSDLCRMTPPNMPPESLKYLYRLRGVATKHHVTYVLRPREQDVPTNDVMVDDDDETPEGMQWWRIEYETSGARIVRTPTSQDDVIRAVELENDEALIVYASEAAISAPSDLELQEPLQDFIRKDNELFSAELRTAAEGSHNIRIPLQENNQRRLSIDSTTVNYDEDDAEEPPPYEAGSVPLNLANSSMREGVEVEKYHIEDSPPAHEIALEDNNNNSGKGVEMVEKAHEPIIIHGIATTQSGSDEDMVDAGGDPA